MSKLYNRARVTVSSTGTGTLTLSTAVAGYQTFTSAGVQNGDVVSYVIEDGLNWEVGEGTYTSSTNTLTRTVTQSFNGSTYGTAAISVTSSAQVFISPLAADIVANGSANTLGVANGGTGTATAFTAGSVVFAGASGVYSQNNASLFWDNTNNSLGIGTSSPLAAAGFGWITVQGSSGGLFSMRAGATEYFRLQSYNAETVFTNLAATPMVFQTSSLPRMTITSGGNVGIGCTPRVLVEIQGSNPPIAITNSSGATNEKTWDLLTSGTGFNIRTVNDAYTVANAAYAINRSGATVSSHIFYVGSSVEALRVDSSSNVGIGGVSTFGTSAAKVIGIANGTAPTTGPADTIQIYSTDLSAGNTMLSLYTEGTPVNANTTAATTHRIAIRVNGTVYYLLANTAA